MTKIAFSGTDAVDVNLLAIAINDPVTKKLTVYVIRSNGCIVCVHLNACLS
jgi:hypothetical protein